MTELKGPFGPKNEITKVELPKAYGRLKALNDLDLQKVYKSELYKSRDKMLQKLAHILERTIEEPDNILKEIESIFNEES